ncbi:MAG: phosphatidylglycerophosphatase A [Chromatiaceae bacterium]|nr:MAG: phosphatidylglycerophosphatase A [Chromatiaceae bacterium]
MLRSYLPGLAHFNTRNPEHWFAFGLGSGLLPAAPGTMGTLAAIPFFLLLSLLPVPLYVLLVAAAIPVGIHICGRVADELGEKDPQIIVGDEMLGYLVAMTAVPAGPQWIIAGLALFRLFDILKPWPIHRLQRLPGGLGIVADDLAAGLATWVVLQGMLLLVAASLR